MRGLPQWSPVDVTGNREQLAAALGVPVAAAMEPGRRDREQAGHVHGRGHR